jgi:hypothetical protein
MLTIEADSTPDEEPLAGRRLDDVKGHERAESNVTELPRAMA